MIWIVLLMSGLGLCLSAFFSGSETGFYRVARVRLVLDARDGDVVSKLLLWLTNNPSFFVATTLIGNNLANYMLSLGILLGTRLLCGDGQVMAEILAPILVSPLVFVYGELLPKNLFYIAPNRLLRLVGPFFLLATIVFAPVAGILWLLARLLQALVGEAPEALQLRLARNELRRLLQVGHDLGILLPSQQRMAQAVFDSARLTLPRRFDLQLARINSELPVNAAREATRRSRHGLALVMEPGSRLPVRYVRFCDLDDDTLQAWSQITRELPRIRATESPLAAIMLLRARDDELAAVVDSQNRIVGVVALEELVDSVIGES